MERWGLLARGQLESPLVSLAHEGAPSNGLEPQEGPWRWGQRWWMGHCQAEGAASPMLRLLRGSQASRERAGLRRECRVRLGSSPLFWGLRA